MSAPENGVPSREKSLEDLQVATVEKGRSSSSSGADNEKSHDRHSLSDTTAAPPDGKKKDHPPSPAEKAVDLSDDSLFAHLPEHEKEILKRQLDAPAVKVSFFILYRYASRTDILIMIVSTICAIAAGAALPLFTVRMTSLAMRLSVVRH
jgi:ATP-binding cassette subfamily B (MDR/TAP) protein 1